MTQHLPRTASDCRQLDKLELLAAGYLLLPVLVFLLGWMRLPFALLLAATLAPASLIAWRGRRHGTVTLSKLELLAASLVAVAWVSFSGLANGFYLNLDWLLRMSMLRDLVVGNWPASYGQQAGGEVILRSALGYYLVPALAGKLTSLDGARIALWAWTAFGAVLFLAMLASANPARRRSAWISALAIAVFFSGMDVIGWLMDARTLRFGQHIEWWNYVRQFSSQTTLMFWVPNHALPGWLLAMIVWRHREHGLAAAPAALLLLSVVFWSPLVAVGALPLLVWCVWRKQGWFQLVRESLRPSLLVLLPVGWVVWTYLTMNVGSASNTKQVDIFAEPSPLVHFMLLEWALLAVAVYRREERPQLFALVLLQLLLMPFLQFGPNSDMIMRGCIPPLAILMMYTIDAWQAARPLRRTVITAILLVGSVTPLLEFQRALQPGPRYMHREQDFVQVNGQPWHYIAPLTHPVLVGVFKTPEAMQPRKTVEHPK